MKLYSILVLICFIQSYNFAPIAKIDCPPLPTAKLIILQDQLLALDGPTGTCTASVCNGRRKRSIVSSNPMCDQELDNLDKMHHKGMEHIRSSLTYLNHSIEIGGYWTIPNFLWNSSVIHQCNFNTIGICQQEEWMHHHDLQISCFDNEQKLLNWIQNILNINDSRKLNRLITNTEINLDQKLPFPNLFNVTILAFKNREICDKSRTNSIACHKRMDGEQCSFYLCHTTSSTEMVDVTLQYEPTNIRLTMTMMCHPLTQEQAKENEIKGGIPNDKICHFLTPQTHFFICGES
jgi:hypothetical protein